MMRTTNMRRDAEARRRRGLRVFGVSASAPERDSNLAALRWILEPASGGSSPIAATGDAAIDPGVAPGVDQIDPS